MAVRKWVCPASPRECRAMTSNENTPPRRVRVERNIYRRPSGVFEVGLKDLVGVQRWRTVNGGLLAARVMRDELLARRGKREATSADPRLRFTSAAGAWLDGPVRDLRESPQASYRNAVDQQLLPRFAPHRLDAITGDDLAELVRSMRAAGKSEATILVVLGVTGRIFKFAARRLGWVGTDPTKLMLSSERPKVSLARKRPIYTGEQIEATIAAASEPFRTMFTVAALTGARMSELCGLTWADVNLSDPTDAELTFGWQVDRHGRRRPTKTDGSARTVPIPEQLALVLLRYRARGANIAAEAFVFATRTGRPLGQRNVQRALRVAQTNARDADGASSFPTLHQVDEPGNCVEVARGELPSMHSFRHTVASRALLAGESVDEVAFLLGHRDGTVTRTVYVREVADARRRAFRRSAMAAEFEGVLRVAAADSADP